MTCDFCKGEIEGGHYQLPDYTLACTWCFDRFLKGTRAVDAEVAIILHQFRREHETRKRGTT